MAVRTKVLARGHQGSSATGGVIYTCPAGRTAVVKDLVLFNATGSAKEVGVSVRRAGAHAQVVKIGSLEHLATHTERDRYVVLEPGDELFLDVAGVTTPVAFRYLACGVELDGVAPA